ncbi:hypothetical protein, partial [Blautia wexlerae]|uniref:hypothetical protein n=2 Tax=Lachnospirales TaxID=3085636 RepID=UPI001C038F5D
RSEIEKAAEMEKSKAVRTLNSLIEKKILMSAPMNSLRHLMMKMKLLDLINWSWSKDLINPLIC